MLASGVWAPPSAVPLDPPPPPHAAMSATQAREADKTRNRCVAVFIAVSRKYKRAVYVYEVLKFLRAFGPWGSMPPHTALGERLLTARTNGSGRCEFGGASKTSKQQRVISVTSRPESLQSMATPTATVPNLAMSASALTMAPPGQGAVGIWGSIGTLGALRTSGLGRLEQAAPQSRRAARHQSAEPHCPSGTSTSEPNLERHVRSEDRSRSFPWKSSPTRSPAAGMGRRAEQGFPDRVVLGCPSSVLRVGRSPARFKGFAPV